MKDSHKRLVLSTFKQIDDSLSEIKNLMAQSVEAERSLFVDEEINTSEEVKSRLSNEISQVRKIMRGFMKKYKIKNNDLISPITIITSIIFSLDIAVSELEPQYSGGYGELGQKAQEELTQLSQELHEHLNAIKEIIEDKDVSV